MTDFHAAPDFWFRKQLKWAVTFQRGHDLPDDAREDGPVPVYAGGGITGWHKEACAPPPGIVTGRYGTIGEFHLVSTPYWPLNTALYSIDLHDNDPEYLRYLLEFLAPLFHVHAGKSAVPGVDRNDIHTIPVALPRRKQQGQVAAFLGSETRRIDCLLQAKQRVLDLLAEKRKAIIATAVTRGLDPRVKLRDSGLSWLGEIQAHWDLMRMKYLFRLVVDKSPVDNDFELLSLYTDVGVKPRRELEERGNKASGTDEYWLVQPGDLVVNKLLAWMGAFGVSEYRGVTSPAYDILRPHNGVESFFYHHLFRCGVATTEVRARSYGIMDMRLRLYFDRLGDMYVPFPPLDEQRTIVEQIARETTKLDAVRAATKRTIALLKERRSALIAAAVTGQLDVGTAA